ncbi:MAG: heat-inducible transcriptional repressor HrcA [Cycloclasticus sp. symbiont of Poecilosclerida sp. M]|nr:MAG: heat-inducible transcriptional repressor HrcA [Cycloclasticus sp. symbiont of Poecilosclerida sp. M]
MNSHFPELNERSQQLLKLLVERFIQDGQPVGSRALSCEKGLGLSSATIRNVMADLEELGLIHSPHTSAGRVPTNSGYRFFVDSLLTVKDVDLKQFERLKHGAEEGEDSGKIITTASQLLSGITNLAGVVTLPKRDAASFRQIEFMPLSKGRILVILVTNDHEVHNRVILTEKNFDAAQLQQAANYLNTLFSGHSLQDVAKIIATEMGDTREQLNQMMSDAITLAHQSLDGQKTPDGLVVTGETNLMGFDELSQPDKLRHLFEAFSEKQDIMHLMDKCMDANGVQVFIGEESGYQAFNGCSLVTASYAVDNQTVGVLGVIGPTRMSYEKVVPLVDVTAKALGEALKP